MPLNIGIIGCGGIASAHLKALQQNPDVRLSAFSDIVVERARSFAETVGGGSVYRDYHEMLERERLDACYICIPPFAHTDQELLCVEKGIPFFVEKPVALSLEKAREIDAAVEKAKLITQVGYVLRFNDAMVKALDILRREGGQIALYQAIRLGGIPGTPWWRRMELSGGQLVEQSTHMVDQARWIINSEVREVFAKFDFSLLKDIPEFNVEDVSIVSMAFENGALACITSSCAAKRGLMEAWVIAKNLQIETNGSTVRVIKSRENVLEINPEKTALVEEDKHFIQCVKDGNQTLVPYKEGLKTLEATLAAVKSAREGRPIRLPL
ncbi:Gfo/Idh/MocA family oxidoreductase [Candidatus Bathyarchaeota archaeon]|nr:Gfo/Idh/MocA family oxidoreductase [Candidatus Bathyarchaeota archaeon]MBS7628026.1 Gfo/Idh/MocA family oxidoreductase [Candidatus Bathyarchaeota archaeon]